MRDDKLTIGILLFVANILFPCYPIHIYIQISCIPHKSNKFNHLNNWWFIRYIRVFALSSHVGTVKLENRKYIYGNLWKLIGNISVRKTIKSIARMSRLQQDQLSRIAYRRKVEFLIFTFKISKRIVEAYCWWN